MKTPVRLLIGALTLLPILAVFAVAGVAAYGLITGELEAHGHLRDPHLALMDMKPELWALVIGGSFFIAIYELILAIAFIAHAASRAYLSVAAKIIWSAALVFFGFVAAPLYWLLHLARAVPEPLPPDFTSGHRFE